MHILLIYVMCNFSNIKIILNLKTFSNILFITLSPLLFHSSLQLKPPPHFTQVAFISPVSYFLAEIFSEFSALKQQLFLSFP